MNDLQPASLFSFIGAICGRNGEVSEHIFLKLAALEKDCCIIPVDIPCPEATRYLYWCREEGGDFWGSGGTRWASLAEPSTMRQVGIDGNSRSNEQ